MSKAKIEMKRDGDYVLLSVVKDFGPRSRSYRSEIRVRVTGLKEHHQWPDSVPFIGDGSSMVRTVYWHVSKNEVRFSDSRFRIRVSEGVPQGFWD